MKRCIAALTAAFALSIGGTARAQEVPAAGPAQTAAQPTQAPPTLVRVSGRLAAAALDAPNAIKPQAAKLVISLYEAQDSATPLWVEEQVVAVDADGRYAAFAGATLPDGLPKDYFAANSARWLGIRANEEPEQPRVMLMSVPYALKAREAETLGGKNLDDFVMSDKLTDSVKETLKAEGVRTKDGTDVGILASTAGRIAKFADSINTTIDSVITESAGNIGIGTAAPGYRLDVQGAQATMNFRSTTGTNSAYQQFQNTSGGMFIGVDNSVGGNLATGSQAYAGVLTTYLSKPLQFGTNNTINFTLLPGGNVGVGTTAPAYRLDVNGDLNIPSSGFLRVGGEAALSRSGARVRLGTAAALDLSFNAGALDRMFISAATGNVGIGTTTPTSMLDVAGNINVTGNINAKYQDVAEWVETSETLEAGTVVIVDPKNPNRVQRAPRAYDTRVAGAVSAQPGLILGEKSDGKAMVAQSGRVRIKVDASYGAIRIGDLLVTSPTPGYAMRSRPVKVGKQAMHRPGTLLGKALESLPNGKGEILVLLTLQ